jgi:hypothetical protein
MKFPAFGCMVTAPGEWVHVMERPHNGYPRGKLHKKICVVYKSHDPVQMENVARWQLPQNIPAMFTAIIREKARLGGPPSVVVFPAIKEKIPLGYAANPRGDIDRGLEKDDVSYIWRRPVLNQHA